MFKEADMEVTLITAAIQFLAGVYALFSIAAFVEGYFRKWGKLSMDIRDGVERILWADLRWSIGLWAAKISASVVVFMYARQIANLLW
jgi:hypothetical protein